MAAVLGVAFGAIVSYVGLRIGHYIDSSDTSMDMYTRDNRYFWFTIPSLPGTAVALLTSSRDWHYDDEWENYFWPIMAYNIVFWTCAFPILQALYAFIASRVFRGHARI